MQKKLLTTCFIILKSVFATAQEPNLKWVKQMTGEVNSGDCGNAVALDALGNVYTTGAFQGITDFDPGPGIFNLTSSGFLNEKGVDIFISKLDSLGNFIWAKKIGGNLFEEGYSIVVDESGNIYIKGYFEGTVDFDPDVTVFNLTSQGGAGLGPGNLFLTKLDSSGKFVWAKKIAGTYQDRYSSMAVDELGNIYTTGTFKATIDVDPGPGTFNLKPVGGFDIFILKLDDSGNFIWANHLGEISDELAYSIALDLSGNVCITGTFGGTLDFNSDSTGIFNLTSSGPSDIFILKLDSKGKFLWAKNAGGVGYDHGYSIAIDKLNNIYTTGTFAKKADFNPGVAKFILEATGVYDIFILKIDSTGNFIWAKSIGGTGYSRGQSIDVDAWGNVYTTGTFEGVTDFDPSKGVFYLSSAGSQDIYVSKLDASGKFVWAGKMGGAYTDWGSSIVVDRPGNVYTTGYFAGIADFDPGPDTSYLMSYGMTDIFILKVDTATIRLKEILPAGTIKIYPNPTAGELKIALSAPTNDLSIELYNSIGELVYKQTTVRELNIIDLSYYACGLYVVKVMGGQQIITSQKIIKQ